MKYLCQNDNGEPSTGGERSERDNFDTTTATIYPYKKMNPIKLWKKMISDQ